LGATLESVLAAGRQLNPALRAAALETSAAAAKAAGADALDDPTLSDSYQYYRNPNVFSGHAVMVTQAFGGNAICGARRRWRIWTPRGGGSRPHAMRLTNASR
jgi:hypothetical protein